MPDGYDDIPVVGTPRTYDDVPMAPVASAYDDVPMAPVASAYDDLPAKTPGSPSDAKIGPATHSKSIFTSLRESLSPLLGPTKEQLFGESIPDGKGNFVYKPAGDAVDREGFFPALSHPMVAIPKAKASPDDALIAAVAKGVYNTGAGFAEFMESPLGIATAGTGALANLPRTAAPIGEAIQVAKLSRNLGRAGAAGYAADMALKTPELAQQAGTTSVTGSTQQKVEANLGLGLNTVLAGSLIGHATEAPTMIADKLGATPTPWTPEDLKGGALKVKGTGGVSEFGGDQAGPGPNGGGYDDLPAAKTPLFDTTGDAVLPTVQTSGATTAPPTPTQTDIAAAPVQRVDAGAITTRPDLMQFKRIDDADTGVNIGDKLAGSWDDLKAGNLLLWEPKDPAQYGLADGEKYIVANGHHRFEFGERNDVPEYNAQVIREADGYSAQDARSLAAEVNIADGKGTIYDQTKFLRNEAATHGPDAALARAGSIGVKGRQAATIAFQAGPDLYDSFVNEQIKPEQAEAVAKAAPAGTPQADALQRLGVRKAIDGSSPAEINNLMQAVRLESRNVAPEQFDLFAADDSALKTAEQLAGVASRIQGELSREIRSTDAAAKNATTAKVKGIAFEKPPEEILAENAKLKGERDRWDNWALHPDLVQQVRDYAEMGRRTAGEAPPAPKTLDEKLRSLKVDLSGKLLEGVTSLPIHIWNASIDAIRLGVKAGKKLSDAIEDGIAWLKQNYPGTAFDENDYRRAVVDTYGVRAFADKIQADPNVTPAVKAQVTEPLYEKRTNETDAQTAQRIIAAHGTEEAAKLYLNDQAKIPGAVRSILGKQLIKAIGLEESIARATGDTAGAARAATRQAEIIDADLKRSTDVAQALQAMSTYGDLSPEGVLQHARRVIGDAGDRVMKAIRPVTELIRKGFEKANADALEEVKQDPMVNNTARAAVNEQIEGSAETKRAVVVDIAGAFAESPEIVRQARATVAANLDRILSEQGGAPLGTRSKAQMDAILDDLSKRAASIAASHYQGAELGKTLAQKLQERLGLSEDASVRLAKQLDGRFAKMVADAQAKIPQRIAAMRAKQGTPFDPNEFSQSGIDLEIRRQLAAMNQKLGQLVQQHGATVDATGRTIGERVVTDAGLTGPRADALQAAFDKRFAELAGDKKQSVINQMLRQGVKIPAKVRSAVSDLVKATNIGAFDDAKFYDALSKKLNLPQLTPDLAREITRRANDLQRLPEGFQRDRASAQLLNFIASQKGQKIYELPMAMWYANVLSGLSTPIHVMLDNTLELGGNTFVSLLRNPLGLRDAVTALGRGAVKGALQSGEILKTGIVTGLKDNVYTSHTLERNPFTGPLSFLNAWKYVGRGLAATHVLAFQPASELRQALAARDVARTEGLSGPALRQRVADILGNTEDRVNAARAQAANEGLTGLDLKRRTDEIIEQQRDQAAPGIRQMGRDYALRGTYLNDPYGVIGNVTKGINTTFEAIAKDHPKLGFLPHIILPFTRIVGNIVNEKMNWSPVGAFRAARGMATGELYGKPVTDPQAVGDLMTKSIVGTVAVSALATAATHYLDDEDPKFAITGNGPANPAARKQLEASGWHPHSFKIGNTYIDYLRTPGAIPLAVVGNYLDALRYRHLDQTDALNRVALVAKGTADTIVHQSFLDSLAKMFEAIGNENTKSGGDQLAQTAARAGSSFVVPNLLMQIDRLFDPTKYDQSDVESMLRAQIPFVRRMNKPALNVLGEPITSGVFDREGGTANPDELWRVLAEKQAWIPEPSRDTIVGDRKRGPDHYRTLTPDEMYDYVETSGPMIRARLEAKIDRLESMEPDQAKKFVQKITDEQRKKTLKMFSP